MGGIYLEKAVPLAGVDALIILGLAYTVEGKAL